MTIHEVVALAKRVHDAEGVTLGPASTRETRNAFWARAIGIVHHGHPTYNPIPDKQWHIKRAAGRPQSDDVVVSLPSRQYWDCIPGAGQDGYRFEAQGPEILPMDQDVYAPPIPSGSTGTGGGTTPPPPKPCPNPAAHDPKPYPLDESMWDAVAIQLLADMKRAGQPTLDTGSGRWFARTIWRHVNQGMSLQASIAVSRVEWCQVLGIPVA